MGNELVILNKYNIIERCIKRIREIYDNNPKNLDNYDKQDAIILNLQRACQATIDIAMYIISTENMGIPQSQKSTFSILEENNIIESQMSKKLKGMIGFRNIAVHEYQELDIDVVRMIIENNLEDMLDFAREMLKKYNH